MSQSTGLIYKQIPKIMAEIDAVSKSRNNTQQGFKFRGIDEVINELHAKLAKNSVFIVPEVLDERREERGTKSGGTSFISVMKIKYTFFAEDGSNVSAVMIGEAADTGDKASNKAQSIALKYVCLQVFAIPTEDEKDPDGQSHDLEPRFPQPKGPAPTPIKSAHKPPAPSATAAQPQEPPWPEAGLSMEDLGEYKVPATLKFGGFRLKDLKKSDIKASIDYWYDRASSDGKKAPDGLPGKFVEHAEAYLKQVSG